MNTANETKEMVRQKYAEIALQDKDTNASSCCGAGGCSTEVYNIMTDDYSELKGYNADADLAKALKAHVAKVIGAIARPDDIRFTGALPKTRSGKIMRRLLKEVVSGGIVKGDTTTLDDLTVLAQLAASSSSDDD